MWIWLVLTVVDEMCFFSISAQRQTPGLTACYREAGRRNHGTAMTRRTPRKGRLRPGKLQLIQSAAVSTCNQFWFTEKIVEKAGGRQNRRQREADRRKHGTTMTHRNTEGPPQARRDEGAHPSWRAHLHLNGSPSHIKVLTPCEMREPIPRGEPISTHLQRGSHVTDAANRVPERQRTACPLGSQTASAVEGAHPSWSFGTNTITRANISTHLLSSTTVS